MWEVEYQQLMADILFRGESTEDRTGVGTYRLFNKSLEIDLAEEFPLMTLRKVSFHSVWHELIWFLRGSTNTQYLRDNKVTIWDEWADENGDLGPVYGAQWRGTEESSHHRDQLAEMLAQASCSPASRRMIVNSWQVRDLSRMRLPPCHLMYQLHVGERVHMTVTQRSADLFLGVPFNAASYAILLRLISFWLKKPAGTLRFNYGDVHLYRNHQSQALELLRREPAVERPSMSIFSAVTHDCGTTVEETLDNWGNFMVYKLLSKNEAGPMTHNGVTSVCVKYLQFGDPIRAEVAV